MGEISLSKTNLIGHSFGGAVAMKLCFESPEKFDKLILCDAAAIRGKKLNARQTAAKLMSDVGAGFIKKTPFYLFFQKIAYRLAGSYNDYYQENPIMREVFKKVVTEDLTDLAPRIKTLCLIVWGENDKATPLEDAFVLHEAIKDSELKIIPGVGHNPYRKNPEEFFASVFEFLKK
jgi:pimeloyl-ACP methyl ester carboxylesterase